MHDQIFLKSSWSLSEGLSSIHGYTYKKTPDPASPGRVYKQCNKIREKAESIINSIFGHLFVLYFQPSTMHQWAKHLLKPDSAD